MKTSQLDPRDYKYIVEDGDIDFNPARNESIVNQVIAETDARVKKLKEEWRDPFAERADAVATYLTSQHGAESGKSIDKYFGKKMLAHLRGEGIKKTVQSKLSPNLWQKALNTRPVNPVV